jgi:hypothetical protein
MLTIAATALVASLACACAAWGAAQPLTGGQTQLDINPGLDKALRKEGVVIEAIGPAKLKGRELTLPVASGTGDPGAGAATLVQAGGLKLVSAGKAVVLRRLELDASRKSLRATIAGKRLKLAGIPGAKVELDGFDIRLDGGRLPLSSAGSAALNRVLGLPEVLRPGRSLGALSGVGEPAAVEIGYGTIWMGGPETVFSKLASMHVEMGIWGATQGWAAPGEKYWGFQTTPTTVSPDGLTGILAGAANDGVTMEIFEAPPRNMLLRGPRIDLAGRELSATVSPLSAEGPVTATIATLDYGPAKFQIRPKVGAFELMGIRAVSNQFIADQLNQRFATPGLFQAGETLARITVNLSARR